MKSALFLSLALSVLPPAFAEPPGGRAPADLREALAAAWERAPQGRALAARRLEAEADAEVADLALAGAPTLALGLRSDRPTEARGRREEELGVALPLWLPGQREARRALAASGAVVVDAEVEAERLRLAGELRERVWAALAATAEADLAAARADTAEALALAVERRVAAGDLARVDALAARGELLAASAARLEARAQAEEAGQHLALLTGSAALPLRADEAVVDGVAADGHPRLRAARRLLERAQAETGVARHAGRAAPEIGLQFQRERDASGLESRGSVRVEFRLPLGSDARQRPLLAAANTARVRAEGELLQLERELAADAERARRQLAAQQAALQLAATRQAAADERRQLLERAFALGELPLAQLLAARADAAVAAAAAVRARTAEGLARARLNQALGVLP